MLVWMGGLLQSRVFAAVLICIGIAGAALSVSVVLNAGIGWDALFEVRAGKVFTSLDPNANLDSIRQLVPIQDVARGTWIYSMATAAAVLLGETFDFVAESPETYQALGLAGVAVFVVGTALTSVVVGIMLKKLWLGALSFALLLTTPLLVGLAGIAYRDAPIAIGLTLVSTGIAYIFTHESVKSRQIISFVLVTGGSFLAIGSRAGSVAIVLAVTAIGLVPLVLRTTRVNFELARLWFLPVLGAFGGTALAVMASPVARLDPIDWLVSSVLLSRSNPTTMLVKVAAQDVMSDQLPVWYIPAYLAAQLPIATLVAICGALLILGWTGVRRWKAPEPLRAVTTNDATHTPSILVAWPYVVQGIVVPIAVVALGANLYDGLRHLLFVVPALLLLIPVAIALAPRDMFRIALGAVASIAVIAGLLGTVRWFPYSYAYVNPVAGVIKEPRIWELDYWGLSAREGVKKLEELGAARVFVSPTANTSLPWGGTEPSEGPNTNVQSGDAWFVFNRWDAQLPPECPKQFEIKRAGHVLGIGGICEAAEISNQ